MDATTELWNAYRTTGDFEIRDRIATENMRLVHHVAWGIQRKLQHEVEFDELVGAGCIGLLQAVDSFEPDRGHAFSTCAIPRIRGAILDELRKVDTAGRDTRKHERMLARAERELVAEREGPVNALQLAERLDVDVDTIHRWKTAVQRTAHVSLDVPAPNALGTARAIGDIVADPEAASVEAALDHEQECALMRQEFRNLTERERVVLMLYYYDELKLREIAEVIGVTESRVSQIRMAALARLRERLAPLREDA